jgi:hypothetical protein
MPVLYKSSLPGGGTMYTRNNCGQRVAPAVGEWPEEGMPHLPYILAIDPDGNDCKVVISTNRNPSELDAMHQLTTLARLKRKGWIVPDTATDMDVVTDANGFRRATFKQHILDEITKRRAVALKKALKVKNDEHDKLKLIIKAYEEGKSELASEVETGMRAVKARKAAGEG